MSAQQTPDSQQIRATLAQASDGDIAAAELLFPLVYDELRNLAGARMRHERGNHTLRPTALVNEVALRFRGFQDLDVAGRSHFLAVAAKSMRCVLRDHARHHLAAKRGEGVKPVALNDDDPGFSQDPSDVLALDEALDALEKAYPRQARVVELRLYSGMDYCDIAQEIGVHEDTIRSDRDFGYAWLNRELSR